MRVAPSCKRLKKKHSAIISLAVLAVLSAKPRKHTSMDANEMQYNKTCTYYATIFMSKGYVFVIV